MKMKRFLTLFLALMMSASVLVSCGDEKDSSSSSSSSSSSDNNQEPPIEWTTEEMLENGKSNYKIVVPENATKTETMAGQELKTYFRAATGVNLNIVEDSTVTWSDDAKYFSVGKTSLLSAAGVNLDQKALGENGYMLKTEEKSLFMAGGTQNGVLYAVQRFLHDMFDYEVYAVDETYYETGFKDMSLPKYDTSVVPDIQQLQSHYGCLIEDEANALRMGYQPWSDLWMRGAIDGLDGRIINMSHNVFDFVPPDIYGDHEDWYSKDKTQVCFSNEEMYEQALLPAVKATIMERPNVKNITVTQMDQRTWCDCTECSADKVKYGSDSGNMIKFGNKVARDVREWLATYDPDREVNIVIFAYHNCELPPTSAMVETADGYETKYDELKFEENLALWWVPSNANFAETLQEQEEINMKMWAALTDNIYVWSYEARFINYLEPYNTHNVLQKNLQFFRDYNVELLFNQGEFNQSRSSDWGDLSIYLLSKLRWDVDADYEALIKDFFEHYYQEASDEMYAFFNHLRAFFAYQEAYLGVTGHKYQIITDTKYWPNNTLDTFMEELGEAYDAIEYLKNVDEKRYEALHTRIKRESIPYRYLQIALYGSRYSSTELLALKNEFRTDCDDLRITCAGTKDITDLWTEWGM